MAQQLIQNLESGQDARNAINGNFTELYGAVNLPIKFPNQSANWQYPIAPNTLINAIFVQWSFGDPVIRIGYTPGGNEIIDDTPITVDMAQDPLPVDVKRPIGVDGSQLYFTIAGGNVNVSMLSILNLF